MLRPTQGYGMKRTTLGRELRALNAKNTLGVWNEKKDFGS